MNTTLDPRLVRHAPVDLRIAFAGGNGAVYGALVSRPLAKAMPRRAMPVAPPTPQQVQTERPFWGPHPDPDIAFIEDEFYRAGFNFLAQLLGAALGRKAPTKLQKAFNVAPLKVQGWGQIADLFNSSLEPETLLQGWETVINRLVVGLFPAHAQQDAAEAMALRAHLLYRAGQRVASPGTFPAWGQALRALPDTASASLQWTKIRGLQYMKSLSTNARDAMLKQLVASKEAGEGVGALQRNLYSKFGQLNRDWRRVALTETAMAVSNGALSSVAPEDGWMAEWSASTRACPACKRLKGQRFRVVAPDAANKNGQTQMWAGKTNVGRSAHRRRADGTKRDPSELWYPACPLHPHCACLLTMHRIVLKQVA